MVSGLAAGLVDIFCWREESAVVTTGGAVLFEVFAFVFTAFEHCWLAPFEVFGGLFMRVLPWRVIALADQLIKITASRGHHGPFAAIRRAPSSRRRPGPVPSRAIASITRGQRLHNLFHSHSVRSWFWKALVFLGEEFVWIVEVPDGRRWLQNIR